MSPRRPDAVPVADDGGEVSREVGSPPTGRLPVIRYLPHREGICRAGHGAEAAAYAAFRLMDQAAFVPFTGDDERSHRADLNAALAQRAFLPVESGHEMGRGD